MTESGREYASLTNLSSETLTLIVRVLGARVTPVSELATVIAALRDGFGEGGPIERLEPATAAPVIAAPKAVRIEAPAKPRRQRRPRVVPQTASDVEISAPEPEPPHTKLLRRADALAHEPGHHHEPIFQLPSSPIRTLRGVVKWFDARTSKGALRLTGIAADIPLNAANLDQSGIKRIYKDQEIEARVEQIDGRTRLLGLALPARRNAIGSEESAASLGLGAMKARQPSAIRVQVKPDTLRRKEARAAAEILLGPAQAAKTPR